MSELDLGGWDSSDSSISIGFPWWNEMVAVNFHRKVAPERWKHQPLGSCQSSLPLQWPSEWEYTINLLVFIIVIGGCEVWSHQIHHTSHNSLLARDHALESSGFRIQIILCHGEIMPELLTGVNCWHGDWLGRWTNVLSGWSLGLGLGSAVKSLRCYGGLNVACRRWRMAIICASPKIRGDTRCMKGSKYIYM